ncbi:MAG: type II toxin-antitoxin system RatA family toxin [Hyphomicrobiaceae bacterium]|nr:MAG: type II toxin-antitoxin system RatA family toxin [Hyphomicrobiaceae bacterium]
MTTYQTRRRVPFTPRQMFDLVADVEQYPKFVPLCEALVVRSRAGEGDKHIITADMTVGYKAIRETFASRVTLEPARLTVTAANVAGQAHGPFRHLENRWSFAEAPGGCDVDFFISYEFKSMMLQMLMGGLFDRAFRRFADAFEERARIVYAAGRSAGAA